MSSDDSILQERAKLINSADANPEPDVTFVVGSTKSLVRAHKIFLMTASVVFKAMFGENFTNVRYIIISDIELDAFTEVIHYCYTLKAQFTPENVLGILYASEKYMLIELKTRGVEYTMSWISENNYLEIYEATHLLDCPPVNEKCVELFKGNPLKCFKDPSFHKLSLTAVRKLAGQPVLNCSGCDVKTAVISWLVANEYCTSPEEIDDETLWNDGFTADNFGAKELYTMKREGSHTMTLRTFKSNVTSLNNVYERKLFGVGLCVGGQGNRDQELVKLTINNGENHRVQRIVKQWPNMTVIDVMLEEAVLIRGTVSINVEFETEENRTVITDSLCLNSHSSRNHNRGNYYSCNKCNCQKFWPVDPNKPYTCLAYLIYQGPQDV